ncbi:MAG: hypothetical protein LQ340_007908, partial [Diploschistes diacapsis]
LALQLVAQALQHPLRLLRLAEQWAPNADPRPRRALLVIPLPRGLAHRARQLAVRRPLRAFPFSAADAVAAALLRLLAAAARLPRALGAALLDLLLFGFRLGLAVELGVVFVLAQQAQEPGPLVVAVLLLRVLAHVLHHVPDLFHEEVVVQVHVRAQLVAVLLRDDRVLQLLVLKLPP